MPKKRSHRVVFAAGLAALTSSWMGFPAMAQYQSPSYVQAQDPNAPYGGQSQYNSAPGQAQAYPQSYAQQQVPAGQYPPSNFQYGNQNQMVPQGNNSQQYYGQAQSPVQNSAQGGVYPYQGQNPPVQNAYGQPQYQQPSQGGTIYGYAADVQQAGGPPQPQYPQPQQGYQGYQQQPQYPQAQQQPVYGYQPQTPQQNGGGLGLQQAAGAYFDQMDQQGQNAPAAGGNENAGGGGGGLGGKLAAGAKTLAGVAVPMATGFLMTQAANKQAKRMGLPSGGIFGNPYGGGYGYNPYGGMGMNPYGMGMGGFGGSPLGGLGGLGGQSLMNGLLRF